MQAKQFAAIVDQQEFQKHYRLVEPVVAINGNIRTWCNSSAAVFDIVQHHIWSASGGNSDVDGG